MKTFSNDAFSVQAQMRRNVFDVVIIGLFFFVSYVPLHLVNLRINGLKEKFY